MDFVELKDKKIQLTKGNKAIVVLFSSDILKGFGAKRIWGEIRKRD
ncbi:hypothetical protein bwei_5343 [Bacillus mycoides]|nr:hypothetical protein [Bacillus mycoides]AIW87886.1 hypothetical protein bwei_5343 [Bacillus mycoides]EEL02936.1 hypothetical protein bcere0014_55180 [Bacillus cereus BDRD-ST196]GAE42730.1 hypothetical protein BW1_072_00370 [Bacillus mycoides NBRC 101238 = DSM 11821]